MRKLSRVGTAPFFPYRFEALALLCAGALAACAPSFDAAYEAAKKAKSGQALYLELLRLDQLYPNRLRLKLGLGSFLLRSGDLGGAKACFDRGEKLLGPFESFGSRYALYADRAELALREGEFKEALAYAARAIASSRGDELGVVFTKAKAESAQGDTAAALRDFDEGWSDRRASMGAEDYRAYALALKRAGRDADALQVLAGFQKALPYESGIGLLESECYEAIGDRGAAMVCAFKEYEFARASGGLSDQALLEALDTALKKGASSPTGKAGERLVATLKAFVRGDWKGVEAVPGQGFGEYVALAAKLEAGSASDAELERYLLLEPFLKSFQAYYLHLWRGMKKSARSYSAKIAKPLLEKCVALAPSSRMALESRRELGRVLGMGEAAGEKLLVPSELDAMFADVLAGAPFSRLDPALSLLETPDNDYQLACLRVLGDLSADPSMKAYLASRAKAASGRLRERLAYVASL
jgi:hypothetical protein